MLIDLLINDDVNTVIQHVVKRHIGNVLMKHCKEQDCKRLLDKAYGRGLCNMHYQRFIRHNREVLRTQESHGMYKRSEYNIWQNIKGRCLNPNDKAYSRYGGRGITISDEWMTFTTFLSDMGDRPSSQHSIDRIDNNKGYSADNCRWALPEVQLFNRGVMRNNTSGVKGVVSYKGKWRARIGKNGKYRELGLFDTIEEATIARHKAEAERLQLL